jgi:hypothetical protein
VEIAQAVRLVVGAGLLATVRARVSSRLMWRANTVRIEVEAAEPLVSGAVAESVRESGIELRQSADGITLTLL